MPEVPIDGAVYALVKNGAIEQLNQEVYVGDPKLILVGRISDRGNLLEEEGCLLFTRRMFAERCQEKLQRSDCIIATFLNVEHFEYCMRDFERRGFRFAGFNRHSGLPNDRKVSIQEAIDAVAATSVVQNQA